MDAFHPADHVAPVRTELREKNAEPDFSNFHLFSDLFRIRSQDPIQEPLLAFPKSKSGWDDWEYFTGKQLDRWADLTAWAYYGLLEDVQLGNTTTSRTIALLGPTNIDWVISTFGLSRAGYTILALSPRLSYQAVVNLMQETNCTVLIFYPSAQLSPLVDQAKAAVPSIRVMPMIERNRYDCDNGSRIVQKNGNGMFIREIPDMEAERKKPAAILHSSGSTGLPKPIYLSHESFTVHYDLGPGERDFITLPLYHAFAIRTAPARMFQRKLVFFPNPNQPMTCEGLTAAMQSAKPSTLCAVPYVLKLLHERESGIVALKRCKQVMFTGSQCPDELGDDLVERGVNLASFIGSTECGFIGASFNRPPGDTAWNFIRPPPPLMKQIWPKPINDDTFEFVYLKDYPGRVVSNADDPPESFHSKDIFTPHKTIPGAWKYLGRVDDRITLINGEKVLPLPIEGRIRQGALVKEAVVFGVGRSIPGLLLFRSEAAKGLKDGEFVSAVWPEIEATNRTAEGFSQIGKDMVVPLPAGIEVPTTDKGSVIRAQVYKTFERDIDGAYEALENQVEGTLRLEVPELERYLVSLGQQIIGPKLSSPHDDLFNLGLDSLQAVQLRGYIVRDLDLGGNGKNLGQNIVFEKGNIANLANYLHNMRLNRESTKKRPIEFMADLISKYSILGNNKPRSTKVPAPDKAVVVLTGATGGLGAHILHQILQNPKVEMIYCLLRGKDPSSRLYNSLKERHITIHDRSRLAILPSDLSRPQLGLDDSDYDILVSRTTHIIHCAWPVNFQLALSAFEPLLRGLQNLLHLSLEVERSIPAHLIFCSSIATALGTPPPARIPETPIKDIEHVSLTGYAQSKFVGERIVQAAVEKRGADATILRIGQVVGDTEWGVWNDSEAFPLIIRSALTMGILPELDVSCEWLPLDTLAKSVIQLAGLAQGDEPLSAEFPFDVPQKQRELPSKEDSRPQSKRLLYNVVSPRTFSWTADLLPALSSAGLSFRPVTFVTWIYQLRKLSTAQVKKSSNDTEPPNPAEDPNQNPAIKLVDFFEENFQPADGSAGGGIRFETAEAERAAPALRETPSVIGSGLLEKMLRVWMEKWKVALCNEYHCQTCTLDRSRSPLQ